MSIPRILLVCTGNICRSPLAEQLLRARLEEAGIAAHVDSAGTRAMVASPMTPEAAALSLAHGAHSTDHSARQLTEQLVNEADLVLTATRDHRREVVTLLPRATRYTFTLNQFARLLGASDEPYDVEVDVDQRIVSDVRDAGVARPRTEAVPTVANLLGSVGAHQGAPVSAFAAVIASVAATRGLHPSPNPATLDDIDDPYRQSSAVYTAVSAVIDESVTTIAAALATTLGQH